MLSDVECKDVMLRWADALLAGHQKTQALLVVASTRSHFDILRTLHTADEVQLAALYAEACFELGHISMAEPAAPERPAPADATSSSSSSSSYGQAVVSAPHIALLRSVYSDYAQMLDAAGIIDGAARFRERAAEFAGTAGGTV